MIEVIGPKDREEYRFALKLAEDILELWPDLEENDERVQIAASAKVFGGRVQDIDIILLAQFGGRRFRTRRPVHIEGSVGGLGPHAGEVSLRNLLITIEVKGHDQSGIRFDGLNAIVRYGSNEKSATDQAMEQMNALRSYAARMAGIHPFVIHLVALENVPSSALPPRPHNMISGDQSFASVLTAICELKAPWQGAGRPTLSCCTDEVAGKIAELPIFRPLQPTALDRKRMERLSASSPQIGAIEGSIGKTQLILRGHGGTGKTSILLQLAKRAYDEAAARSLILTYNQALAADIRRLMTLAAVPTTDEIGGIRVETVMTFVNRVSRHLGLLSDDDDPLERYEERADELARLLESDAITDDDIRQLTRLYPEEFRYDHVMIDEGQDWPRGEIAIMRALYGSERLVIADGIDQFIRDAVADWRVGASDSETVRLRQCLRMKANLARFANAIAEELGAPGWKVQPNPGAMGGRVIVIEGQFDDEIELHRELIDGLRMAGNAPIDCLYCIPPSMVSRNQTSGRESTVAAWLKVHGQRYWDGASADVRRDIPRDIEAVRIVQYQSCRGLEGWTVVAAGLDELWETHCDSYESGAASSREQAMAQAARWTMIPLSRAMDTLVINVRSAESALGAILRRVADRMTDVVDWRS